EPPQGTATLFLIRIVGGELLVDGLGVRNAPGALEGPGLEAECLRGLRALRILAHELVERRKRQVSALLLLKPREIEEPRRAAIGGQLTKGPVHGRRGD